MLYRHRVIIVAILWCLFSVIGINNAEAAWWDAKDIPVPPNTQVEKEQTREVSGSDFEFTYYSSTLSQEEIKDFYHQRLAVLGWNEKDLAAYMKQGPATDFAGGPDFEKLLQQNLIFEKGSEMAIINFLPAGIYKDNKTRFTLCRGNSPLEKRIVTRRDAIPALKGKPKKDVVPEYPKASLTSLSEERAYFRATYFTKDDLPEVSAFYKEKMPDYGWELVSERPAERLDSGASNYSVAQKCPTCPPHAEEIIKTLEMWFTEMDFVNARGDACRIGATRIISNNEALAKDMDATTIMVSYEEKKK